MPTASSSVADCLIVGGGVAGASTAMQLALRGQRVEVFERQMLGAGSTGRAAGLLGQLRSTQAATAMLVEGLSIVRDLERRTGTNIFVETGSLRVAQNPLRDRELAEHVALGKEVGLPVDFIENDRVRQLLPYMRTDDLTSACYCPTDGHLQPAELLAAFVSVARQHGAQFHTNTPVERVLFRNGQVAGLVAAGREFHAPVVVNAGGPWSSLVAESADSHLATAPIGHYYLTTAPIDETRVDRLSPAVRDRENRIYSRPEAGGLLVGIYEANPVEYDMQALGPDFDMSAMRAARNSLNVAQLIDAASQRFPWIDARTRMSITTGIMTFTPDGKPFCGQYPDRPGLFHCSGFSGHGIVQSPAIGLIMAELILKGDSHFDISEIEADRYFDLPELRNRGEVKRRCYQMYADYYGKAFVNSPTAPNG